MSILSLEESSIAQNPPSPATEEGGVRIPDEQRLYEALMAGYEKSVRPVINATDILVIKFNLRLNQIVDLDERHQVLTTNVFIDQEWRDENLLWKPIDYNGIRSMRVPAKNMWLPDTFIYNNADDGSTGFMRGNYVLVTHDGTIIWPVPVKLKSSCKVDIKYFPFDDQLCMLRFGSWIYSGDWIDYITMYNNTPVDLTSYVNNSEWLLLSISLKKNIRTHSCCPDTHPDMTFTLHIRRRTFYYIFNIIVPCSMLSVLTLLTFWLPPTSGEKITLGLNVFLAFSMFMLLIAEEVPATSEAVPLIGIYLCAVMTMTSVSVIMAVMVINLHNRGMKTRRAPGWLRVVILRWLSRPLNVTHDIEKLIKSITLEEEREGLYSCAKHKTNETPAPVQRKSRYSIYNRRECHPRSLYNVNRIRNRRYSRGEVIELSGGTKENTEEEVIWLRREGLEGPDTETKITNPSPTLRNGNNVEQHLSLPPNNRMVGSESFHRLEPYLQDGDIGEVPDINRLHSASSDSANICARQRALHARKQVVAEWQRIAIVIDRILFWFYFLGTSCAYLVILFVIPRQNYATWADVMPRVESAGLG